MFDPEEDRGSYFKLSTLLPKHPTRPISPPPPPIKQGTRPTNVRLQSEEDTFHTYMDMSERLRQTYGFSKIRGKFYLVDKAKVDSQSPGKKEILRSWVKKMQAQGLWGGTYIEPI